MIKLSSIKANPNNPRVIKDDKFKKLCNSLQSFPKMMELRPIITDDEGVILGGNMRLKALQELGFKEVPDNWIRKASDLTEDEKREFIVKDNVGFGEWDWDMLANEWDEEKLDEWGLKIKGFDENENAIYNPKHECVIECQNEIEQEKAYNDLTNQGYKCRILTL